MKKVEQVKNIKLIIDDSYCNNENTDDILKECGKLINEVNSNKERGKIKAVLGFVCLTLKMCYSIINR